MSFALGGLRVRRTVLFDWLRGRYACLPQVDGPEVQIAGSDSRSPIVVRIAKDRVTVTVLRQRKSLLARPDSLPSPHRVPSQQPATGTVSGSEVGRCNLADPDSMQQLEELLDPLCRRLGAGETPAE
jgi:hypothetical protein